MEPYQTAPQSALEEAMQPARLVIGVGRPGQELLLEADPLTGGIRVTTIGDVDLEFAGDDFDLVTELLQRALGN